jgi:hypothetical protein
MIAHLSALPAGTALSRPVTPWTAGPWAACQTADELAERCRLVNRRWWDEGGWLVYAYYRALAPSWPPGMGR